MSSEERQSRGETIELRAVVDRIEDGEVAVLSVEDEQKSLLDVPLSRLPKNISDGDHLVLTFEAVAREGGGRKLLRIRKDRRARADAEARVRALQERLSKRSATEGKKDFKL